MYNFYIKIYTIDFKIIEYLTIESKLQLSPIGGVEAESLHRNVRAFLLKLVKVLLLGKNQFLCIFVTNKNLTKQL
jgi:hypothetical protein